MEVRSPNESYSVHDHYLVDMILKTILSLIQTNGHQIMLNCPSNINISRRHKNQIVKIQTGAKVFYLNLSFEFLNLKSKMIQVSCFLVDLDVNLVMKTAAMIKKVMSVTSTLGVLQLIKIKN